MSSTQGKGTIFQMEKDKPKGKCRKWQLRISTGKDPRTGKYTRKTKVFEGTYTQAQAELRKFIAAVEGDKVQGRTSYTFGEYADRYLDLRRAKKEVAPTTIKKQEDAFKLAKKHLGFANLAEITPMMIDEMYIALLKGDTLSGKPAGGSYVHQLHNNITLIFKHAVKEGILVFNPCDKANPPKMDTKEKRALDPKKAHELVSRLNPEKDNEMAYLLAITMGLRRGEICGLSWNDIDFEHNIIDISHAFDTLGNLKQTKTKAGMRLLPMSETTCEALLIHKEAQLARYTKTNSYRKPHEGYIEQTLDSPVITTLYGQRVYPGSLTTWWTKDRKEYGLDGWCLHELRHTYLTLLAIKGVHPKVMQELAGHYSSQITMDIYTHVNMDTKRDAVKAVSDLF